jgi:glycerol kinase
MLFIFSHGQQIMDYFLAIDQGTSSSRCLLFNEHGTVCQQQQQSISLAYPQSGWVEQDPEEIWQSVYHCTQQILTDKNLNPDSIKAIGITNQRETTVVWHSDTGIPVYPAIVWQDRRTSDHCAALQSDAALNQSIQTKTGLLLDPYFSATKISWILEHVEHAKTLAKQGKLRFGTIDTFLLWRLTGGAVHATDASNAARTMLYNINTHQWDEELLQLFKIPRNMLPTVHDCAYHFGHTDPQLFNCQLPITGMSGDQQAATIGQACIHPGMVKSTYGTGCFMLANTGHKKITSHNRLLTTIAYQLNGQATYGLEGSIFVAGAAVQWLRDALKLFTHANETDTLALAVSDTAGVYLVPAFTGLGAPHWDPHARGALLGLTRDTSIEHIVRAALEAVCYQTLDLLTALQKDIQAPIKTLRVDGGMTNNQWLLQCLSDINQISVERPACIESSALGAAMLAALGCGHFESLEQCSQWWQPNRTFNPILAPSEQAKMYAGWQNAVNSTQTHAQGTIKTAL